MAAFQSTFPAVRLAPTRPQLASPPVTPLGILDGGPLLRPEFPPDDVRCLPFVRDYTRAEAKLYGCKRSFWSCPPETEYVDACRIGTLFAAAWLTFEALSRDCGERGLPLYWVTNAMPAENDGYSVGFVSHLVRYVRTTAMHLSPDEIERDARAEVERDRQLLALSGYQRAKVSKRTAR